MSLTVDIKDFSSNDFDAKSWINSVLKPTISMNEEDDGGAKDTTILVTKLQMLSESTSRQFDQQSTLVIKSMPRILYDLKLIADNAKSTHQGVEAVKKNLGLIEGEAALEQLRKPHIAKKRMEECRSILLEKSKELEEQQREKEALEALVKRNEIPKTEPKPEPEPESKPEPEPEVIESIQEKEPEKELVVELDQGLEYGHVQLPPLRATPRRVPTPTTNHTVPEDNSYLQQMTPSSVFKRIGVPLDKFWQ